MPYPRFSAWTNLDHIVGCDELVIGRKPTILTLRRTIEHASYDTHADHVKAIVVRLQCYGDFNRMLMVGEGYGREFLKSEIERLVKVLQEK